MDYISCMFLKEESAQKEASPIADVDYHTLDSALEYAEAYLRIGLRNFLVFGSTARKSVDFACEHGLIRRFIEEAKNRFGEDIVLHADAGLSPYTVDGRSIVMENGKINVEKSYSEVVKLGVAFASAGADFVAPCLSLHERVGVLRRALDEHACRDTKIHAYSSKFSSALYGPYRSAIQNPLDPELALTPYLCDCSDPAAALNQLKADQAQGADIVMVKPAMAYLDIVYRARQMTKLPLSVYHVSGEYSMVKSASATGKVDENEAFDEIHAGFGRCGVDFVIGYAPDHFLRWRQGGA